MKMKYVATYNMQLTIIYTIGEYLITKSEQKLLTSIYVKKKEKNIVSKTKKKKQKHFVMAIFGELATKLRITLGA